MGWDVAGAGVSQGLGWEQPEGAGAEGAGGVGVGVLQVWLRAGARAEGMRSARIGVHEA